MAVAEAELVARLRDRDESAFIEMDGRYRSSITRWARHHVHDPSEVEDVVQEVLLAAWSGSRRLWADSDLGPWLKTITNNTCRKRTRTWARRGAVPAGLTVADVAAPPPDVAEALDVDAALDSMPPREAQVLRLLYTQDRPLTDAASLMQISDEAARSLAARARRRFRDRFQHWFHALVPIGSVHRMAARTAPTARVNAALAAGITAAMLGAAFGGQPVSQAPTGADATPAMRAASVHGVRRSVAPVPRSSQAPVPARTVKRQKVAPGTDVTVGQLTDWTHANLPNSARQTKLPHEVGQRMPEPVRHPDETVHGATSLTSTSVGIGH